MDKHDIEKLLETIAHPESGRRLIFKNLSVDGTKVQFTIVPERMRDPFAGSLKREAVRTITEAFPKAEVVVFFEESAKKEVKQEEVKPAATKSDINKIIAIASGKGGVGKSTVTANIAFTLAEMGYKVGVLDADIYGPSQPALFGVEGYIPEATGDKGEEMMIPAVSHGIKIMSIGFFIDPKDALVWRGPMATSALKQLIHQTRWGELDFLLIDMPPGTGDVHLTVLQELKVNGAIIVSTPQRIAIADVVRGISMFTAEKINIPVLGIVENMSWFTPTELPDNRYYVFGHEGVKELASIQGLNILGEIPLVLPQGAAVDGGIIWNVDNRSLKNSYMSIVEKIINK